MDSSEYLLMKNEKKIKEIKEEIKILNEKLKCYEKNKKDHMDLEKDILKYPWYYLDGLSK